MVVKVRPIISHCAHPLRHALRRVARALAILVAEAREVVKQKLPSHLPIWQLHSGIKEWLQLLSNNGAGWEYAEYDVADCFLNTPRELVMQALHYWSDYIAMRSRRVPCFAISKDGKKGDHRGRPACVHYWTITTLQVLEVCEWELAYNSCFEAVTAHGDMVVLEQAKGLPIGPFVGSHG